MKFPHKKSKIEKIVSSDPSARVLHHPWLDIETSTLRSSSGRNGIIVPCEVEPGDTSGPVPVQGIKAIRGNGASIQCGEDWVVLPDGSAIPRGQFSKYPAIEPFFQTPQPSIEVSLDVKALYLLAQGLGTEVVKLHVGHADGKATGPSVVLPHPSFQHVIGSSAFLLPPSVETV